MKDQISIAVCFFGITRSLEYTVESILKNVLAAAAECGHVKTFGHFFELERIENPRSGEFGDLRRDEHKLLAFDELILEPSDSKRMFPLDQFSVFGDSWEDGLRSLGNLLSQLHSLDRVTEMALSHEPRLTIFCRPDLQYHDSLESIIRLAIKAESTAFIPYWQSWNGCNDRFAIVSGCDVAKAYGQRGRRALEFCTHTAEPLHSERLVQYALNGFKVQTVRHRASRVRFNGTVKNEDFWHPDKESIARKLKSEKVAEFLCGLIHHNQSKGLDYSQ